MLCGSHVANLTDFAVDGDSKVLATTDALLGHVTMLFG